MVPGGKSGPWGPVGHAPARWTAYGVTRGAERRKGKRKLGMAIP